MSTSALLTFAATAVAMLWLLARLLRAGHARQRARAGYFDAVAGLFQSTGVQVQPSGFARMSGVWNGARFDLQAVPDTLTFRKLPVLWVMVTLTEPTDLTTEAHIMARPGGNDVFSTFDRMPVSVALPDGFPAFCALRCENAAALPRGTLIAAQAPLFLSAEVKELVMSPRGLRLVVLAEQADRGAYLLFRDAEMGYAPFPPGRLLPLLQALVSLRDGLSEPRERAVG